jgi:Zinc carboxypeptidase
LWSGELHGNERVGPTAVLEATQLLLDAAMCEALPRTSIRTEDPKAWKNELQRARDCRDELYSRGIDDPHRQWLARLVTTRRITVVPTANALGYYQNTREENRIDPNRDFPYDQMNPKACMQTIAARTLNEIFRQQLVQLSLTFHGGMEVIGYEWGAPSYSDYKKSPDDAAQLNIARAYSQYAGSFGTTPVYDFGPYVIFISCLCRWKISFLNHS